MWKLFFVRSSEPSGLEYKNTDQCLKDKQEHYWEPRSSENELSDISEELVLKSRKHKSAEYLNPHSKSGLVQEKTDLPVEVPDRRPKRRRDESEATETEHISKNLRPSNSQESLPDLSELDVRALIHKITCLAEEKIDLVFEVPSIIQSLVTDRAYAKEELRHLTSELYSRTQRLERERNEFQSSLEKEIDRRSSNPSLELEFRSEEHRLREQVRQLAEQNAAMQREVSAMSQREMTDGRNTMTHTELQLERGMESLTRSLQTVSVLLHEKINLTGLVDDPQCMTEPTPEKILKSELTAESLLSNLLLQKLHRREMELEQLRAELTAAVRGNDILKCEVRDALDSLSCTNHHKLKELELQTHKKDFKIKQIQIDLHESTKELSLTKEMLRKVSDKRDLMLEEVKQYSKNNIFLNSELDASKKKIAELDEEVLEKDGQITILRDHIKDLESKPFIFFGNRRRNSELDASKKKIAELDEEVLEKDGQITILRDHIKDLESKPFIFFGNP